MKYTISVSAFTDNMELKRFYVEDLTEGEFYELLSKYFNRINGD